MADINLVRVDDRLVHGQVMQVWSKGRGTNAVFVIDDATAADDFMKEIYESTQSTGGLTIKVFSSDSIIDEWNKNQFGDYKVILVYKSLVYVQKSVDAGIPITAVNVGGIAIKNGATRIIESVGLTAFDADTCKEIADKGVEVYFQKIPSSEKVGLSAALSKM